MGFFLFQHHFTSMYLKVIVFLFLNFGALALGGIFAGAEQVLTGIIIKQSSVTPRVGFGFADNNYVCFSVYMAFLYQKVTDKRNIISLYIIQDFK